MKLARFLYLPQLLIYRVLAVFIVLLLGVLFRLRLLPPKLLKMVNARRSRHLPLVADDPIWIHAASGEIEYAKPVIRAIRERFPQIPVVVSYFSPSAERLLPAEDEMLKTFPIPWDTRRNIQRALSTLKPRAVLFARTDAWPEIVHQCARRQIPTLLFSATLAENSSKKFLPTRPLISGSLERITEIHAVSDADREQFKLLGVTESHVHVHGDTRFDQVLFRLSHPRISRPKPASWQGKVFIVGSSWPEDEAVLIPAIKRWVDQGNHCVLAPHETHSAHMESLMQGLRAEGLSAAFFSALHDDQWSGLQGNRSIPSILIVDTVGILADLYAWGDCAFVGGSFKGKVHSVMEPLAAGLPVCVGPFHVNNREAILFQSKNTGMGFQAVTVVKNTGDIRAWLDLILSAASPRSKIRSFAEEQCGATEMTVRFLNRILRRLSLVEGGN